MQVVSRTSKLTYMWKGMAHLPSLLQRLVKEEDQGADASTSVQKAVWLQHLRLAVACLL
jgi:hypothetical protein